MTKITQQNFIKACKIAKDQSSIAKILRIARSTVSEYIKNNPKMKEIFEEGKEIRIDKAQNNLDKALDDKEEWATKLTLTTQGKDRGFTTKVEIDQKLTAEIQLRPTQTIEEILDEQSRKDKSSLAK